MARAHNIHLVYLPDSSADAGYELFGAFTVKREMQRALARAGLTEQDVSIQTVRDGSTLISTNHS